MQVRGDSDREVPKNPQRKSRVSRTQSKVSTKDLKSKPMLATWNKVFVSAHPFSHISKKNNKDTKNKSYLETCRLTDLHMNAICAEITNERKPIFSNKIFEKKKTAISVIIIANCTYIYVQLLKEKISRFKS
jgi:hypothetical protein